LRKIYKVYFQLNLTYFEDFTDDFLPFEMINNGLIDIVLTASPPKSATNFTECIQPSRAIGDVTMIIILSIQKPISSMFRFVHIFSFEIWTGILIFYFVLPIISFILCNDFCIFIDYLAIALRQNLVKFESKQKHLQQR
jgi:hypothetical protein